MIDSESASIPEEASIPESNSFLDFLDDPKVVVFLCLELFGSGRSEAVVWKNYREKNEIMK